MTRLIGHIHTLTRYPVNSFAGLPAESALLGRHGLEGDRRFAFRRLGSPTGYPWLTASRVPQMLLYQPLDLRPDETSGEPLPTRVRSPAGVIHDILSTGLEGELEEPYGGRLELMHLGHGIFDDACISVISLATISALGGAAGRPLDPRRFRANVLLETNDPTPFAEDRWVGGRLLFGETEPRPVVSVTSRDLRCVMINLDPDTAQADERVMKAAVQLNANYAGVYGATLEPGLLRVGQPVHLVLD